jgi:hypothetical protein
MAFPWGIPMLCAHDVEAHENIQHSQEHEPEADPQRERMLCNSHVYKI